MHVLDPREQWHAHVRAAPGRRLRRPLQCRPPRSRIHRHDRGRQWQALPGGDGRMRVYPRIRYAGHPKCRRHHGLGFHVARDLHDHGRAHSPHNPRRRPEGTACVTRGLCSFDIRRSVLRLLDIGKRPGRRRMRRYARDARLLEGACLAPPMPSREPTHAAHGRGVVPGTLLGARDNASRHTHTPRALPRALGRGVVPGTKGRGPGHFPGIVLLRAARVRVRGVCSRGAHR